MKRTFKFRIWDPEEGTLDYYGEIPMASGLSDRLLINNYGKPNEDVIMQWTGLQDQDGNDLYEGDLLLDEDSHMWEVRWSPSRAWFSARDTVSMETRSLSEVWVEKILGNIYQNPNILEGL